MASSSSTLSEDQLQCSICLDVFTDPVSTPCGHNFCMICLKKFWDSSSDCTCPVCKTSFSRRPDLCVNTFISGLAAPFRKSDQIKFSSSAKEPSSKSLVFCEICTEKKHNALKSCLICMTSYCSTHLEPHQRVAALKKHKLVDPVENVEDYICQKHEKPLEMFCRDDQMCVCQVCTLDDHRNHKAVPLEEESEEKKSNLRKTQSKFEELIQERVEKIKEIKKSVELHKTNTENEKSESMEIFRALILCIKRNQAELLKVMEEKQKAAERQAAEFIKDLEQEITEIKRRKTELEQISHTEDHLHLLQMYPSLCVPPPTTTNCTHIKINPHLSADPRIRMKLQKSFNEKIEKLIEIELRRIKPHAVDVTLDPDTAHPKLILSDYGKLLKYGVTPQNLPNNRQRFDEELFVMGKGGFTSGRVYYEVEVRGKTAWVLGIVSESSNRKGWITESPEDGYWCLWMTNENEYEALESPPVYLSLKAAPQKVGVFVDYEEGLISFYDVENKVHIHSFTNQSFTKKIYPIFSPCDDDDGDNSSPLVICPANQN